MKFPEFLPAGGTIGFAAPSFGCAGEPYRSAFNNAQKVLKKRGYQLQLGPNCYAGEGIGISSTPEKCGKELTDMYVSRDNDVMISCGGGELMCEILDLVDFEKIRQAKPKWYMGYSDNTNFTFLLTTLCDTASVYGPCAGTFGMEPWHASVTDAMELLEGKKLTLHNYDRWEKEGLKTQEDPLVPYNVTEPVCIRPYVPARDSEGKAELVPAAVGETITLRGRLLGGCLDCLVNLAGTCYDRTADFSQRYRDDGILWFLESCDLNVFAIRRAIWELKHAGWFSHVKGFLIGRPACFGQEMMGLDQYHAVLDLLADLEVPVIMDVDLGHLPPMMPLICGSMAEAVCGVSQKDKSRTLKIAMETR